MSYNLNKFAADVSRLFKPRPPLEYKKPVDYPVEKRQTCPHISGVADLLRNPLTDYTERFPEGSENLHLRKYEEVANHKIEERQHLENELRRWDPHNDPNMKDTDPYRTIFVGRLPYDTSEIELQKKFSEFGEIEKVRVVRDKINNHPKGYAFIVFTDPQSSRSACKEYGLHRGIKIKDRTCIVDIERGRTVRYFKPRRLGGGLGGRGYTRLEESSRFSTGPTTRFSEQTHRRTTYDTKRYGTNWPPRPRYTGPSRFSHSAPVISDHRGPSMTSPAVPVKTSYRSRNARAQETRETTKNEEPDY
ncbi:hypothetical protein HG537_0D05890 [Torulaspora globosa]|uniref:RRM domain-containing protein n=1 Tax=Torulaspora globosa TaxID=48254 RepID=A0A7H9HS78_9SACH|nr:hypothetical protein HG537_0D05890 [Torulaspora sp. CBS 2947]